MSYTYFLVCFSLWCCQVVLFWISLSVREGWGRGNYQFPDELINISVHLSAMTPALQQHTPTCIWPSQHNESKIRNNTVSVEVVWKCKPTVDLCHHIDLNDKLEADENEILISCYHCCKQFINFTFKWLLLLLRISIALSFAFCWTPIFYSHSTEDEFCGV